MTTLVVSMGWMTIEATLPEREPMMKGNPYFSAKLSEDILVDLFFKIFYNQDLLRNINITMNEN